MAGFLRDTALRRALTYECFEPRLTPSTVPLASTNVGAEHDEFSLAETLHRLHIDYQLSGHGQTVVVVDSGIAYDHVALGGGYGAGYQVVGGWDFTEENDGDPYDDPPAGFHGTHVAGIIASQDQDYPGIAPNVDLVALRVFDDSGRSDFDWIEEALQWVYDHRMDFAFPITTVNLSIAVGPMDTLASEEMILEDELEQLNQAGIFVSVAAGNGFDREPVAGLSYPASSPWVVPVAAVNADGGLSRFTRREAGMLLAPGEQVLSTAPDYLEDFNGVTDDWFAFSGTSQAAPHVAGAAVLLREAIQRATGHPTTPERLHEILLRTGDAVFDAHGNEYTRLNLLRAVESVLPHVPPTEPESDHDQRGADSEQFAFGTDLGAVQLEHLDRVELHRGEEWYRFETAHEGVVTIEADFGVTANVDLELFDTQGKLLATSYQAGGHDRIDWFAPQGQKLVVRLVGEPSAGTLTLLNLETSMAAEKLQLHLPSEVESIQVDLSRPSEIRFGAVKYEVPERLQEQLRLVLEPHQQLHLVASATPVSFYARPEQIDAIGESIHVSVVGGADVSLEGVPGVDHRLSLYGSGADDVLTHRDAVTRLATPQRTVSGRYFEQVFVFAGKGHDRAELHGTSGDDLLVANSEYARLTDDSRLVWIEGFDRIYAYANPEGVDRAFLYGSAGNDSLATHPSYARLATQDQVLYAESFDRVYAVAGAGGLDRAYLHGSRKTDWLAGSADETVLSNSDYLVSARAFDRVYAYAGKGDGDVAKLNGSRGNDLLKVRDDEVSLGSELFHLGTFGFDRVYAEAGEGDADRADVKLDQALAAGEATDDWLRLIGLAIWHLSDFDSYEIDLPGAANRWLHELQ